MRPADRPGYIRALQHAQAGPDADDVNRLLYERLNATLDEYVAAPQAAPPVPKGS